MTVVDYVIFALYVAAVLGSQVSFVGILPVTSGTDPAPSQEAP